MALTITESELTIQISIGIFYGENNDKGMPVSTASVNSDIPGSLQQVSCIFHSEDIDRRDSRNTFQ